MTKPRNTFIYIAEPPSYDIMSCTLLASIRTHFPEDTACIGYVPEHKMKDVHPAVFKAHELMGAEIRPIKTEDMWKDPYPHGNKIVAALDKRDCDFTAFIDTDVLFVRPNNFSNFCKPGHVSASVAASMYWAPKNMWDLIYGAFDMPITEERVFLMRQNKRPKVPYFSAAFVVFEEKGIFPGVWYDTARRIDEISELDEHRRPYLDQMSLALAVQRSGLSWEPIPEEQHYNLGGVLRGEPLPEDRELFMLHYRKQQILKEVGRINLAHDMLQTHSGERFVRRLTEPKDK